MSQRDLQDEITLKEIAQILRVYLLELKSRWKVILYLFLAIGSVMVYRATTTKISYKAEMTFMINDEKSGLSGGIGSLLGDFGFGGGGEQNLERILKIAQSRKIFGMVVFESFNDSDSNKILANDLFLELQEHYNLGKKPKYKFWQKESALKGFQFHHNKIDSFGRKENTAFLGMYGKLALFLTTKSDEETGIMELSISSHHEMLSYNLCYQFYRKISDYYIRKVVEKQRETFELIKNKVDSIRADIQVKEYEIARYDDSYRNIWQKKVKVPISALQKNVQMSYIMLGEAIKNQEFADFSLKSNTPFIQAIDEPIMPLKTIKPSWLKAMIQSFLIAFLLGSCFIILSKWVRDLL